MTERLINEKIHQTVTLGGHEILAWSVLFCMERPGWQRSRSTRRSTPGTTLFDLGGLQVDLEEMLGVPVDLLTPGTSPSVFAIKCFGGATDMSTKSRSLAALNYLDKLSQQIKSIKKPIKQNFLSHRRQAKTAPQRYLSSSARIRISSVVPS